MPNRSQFRTILNKKNWDHKPWRSREISGKDGKSKTDTYLQRCAWGAQILLFLAAIAGYFLTVRPIYQKQLLDEQIAERTVLLREATSNLKVLQREEARLKKDNEIVTAESNATYNRLRENLLRQTSSASSYCVYIETSKALDGKFLVNCVASRLKKDIATYLRPNDKEKFEKALKEREEDIASLPVNISKEKNEKLREEKRNLSKIKKSSDNNIQKFLAEIRRIRSQYDEPSRPIKTLKDVDELRNHEETNAYIRFIRQQEILNLEEMQASVKEAFSGTEIKHELYEGLTKILRKIADSVQQ